MHYQGWNKNWDEWVDETRILKASSENFERKEKLFAQHQVREVLLHALVKFLIRLVNIRSLIMYILSRRAPVFLDFTYNVMVGRLAMDSWTPGNLL